MEENSNDKIMKEILTKASSEMPFPDFEDELMSKINELEVEEKAVQEGYRRGVAFSWVFFIVGIIIGVVLTQLIPQLKIPVQGVDSEVVQLIFQVGFILFILLHFEKLMTMTRGGLFKTKNQV
ncbi:hypothetical protein [Rhodohalobacter sp.]|uniref:hypothetical protein n=1 Tax=Rhodohalobacter sp. TaxID=1974210 RepID=UPI002ACD9845|nr:hypothetical protein [Rhodohalobacter sp.]MDZ7755113.1 hypothetical protein [Rhodohalobacter sp.]